MGLFLDSSVVIAAERRGDTVTAMLKQIVAPTGNQRAVLSAVGLTELAHGIYRAQTAEAVIAAMSSPANCWTMWTVSLHKRQGAASRKNRRGAAEAGRHHSVRGFADRRYRARSGLLLLDLERTALPTDSRPIRDAALVPAPSPQSYFFAPVSLTRINRDVCRSFTPNSRRGENGNVVQNSRLGFRRKNPALLLGNVAAKWKQALGMREV